MLNATFLVFVWESNNSVDDLLFGCITLYALGIIIDTINNVTYKMKSEMQFHVPDSL